MADDKLQLDGDGAVEAAEEAGVEQPEIEKLRSRINIKEGRIRSKTIAGKRLTREERRMAQLIVYPEDVEKPETRAHCQGMPRPCPFVSCAHHLYLDVNPESGAIKLNFPHLEVWEMKETCALDVADRGGITLEEVGEILNLTRERIRQVEVRGLSKMREQTADDFDRPAKPVATRSPTSQRVTLTVIQGAGGGASMLPDTSR
jgi:Sigma-70, region 4